MTGPHPLPPGAGDYRPGGSYGGYGSGYGGPPRHAAHPGGYLQDYPDPPTGPVPVLGGYPLPPATYPKRSRWPLVLAVLLAVGLMAGVAAALINAVRDSPSPLTNASATTAIQGYLDGLTDRDIDVIARNTLCGTYDAVADRRSDEALAKLSSDAFRKQFDEAEVTSIDKIVLLSEYQAQVLFSMRVTPAAGGGPRDGVQGTAQLLVQGNQVLVCSYVLRTGGTY